MFSNEFLMIFKIMFYFGNNGKRCRVENGRKLAEGKKCGVCEKFMKF